MTTLLSRLERMVAAVELPDGCRASVSVGPGEPYVFCVVSPMHGACVHVLRENARAMYACDVRKLVLDLVDRVDDGDAPVPTLVGP